MPQIAFRVQQPHCRQQPKKMLQLIPKEYLQLGLTFQHKLDYSVLPGKAWSGHIMGHYSISKIPGWSEKCRESGWLLEGPLWHNGVFLPLPKLTLRSSVPGKQLNDILDNWTETLVSWSACYLPQEEFPGWSVWDQKCDSPNVHNRHSINSVISIPILINGIQIEVITEEKGED